MSKAKSVKKKKPGAARTTVALPAADAARPAPVGMSRDEYLAFIEQLLAKGVEADRVSDVVVVIWAESKTYGVGRPRRRPVHCELRADGLVAMVTALDEFRGERAVAKALLDRNFLQSVSTRSAIMGDQLVQFWACRLEHLCANEWLAALAEIAALADQISIELGLPCTYQQPPAPSAPRAPTGTH